MTSLARNFGFIFFQDKISFHWFQDLIILHYSYMKKILGNQEILHS